jgi:hypothetical protein
MALSARQLTLVHRRQQLALRKTTIEQVEAVWPSLDWENLDKSFPGFAAEVLAVVSKGRRTSTGLSAAYLRAFRVASGLSGDVRIVLPQMPTEQFVTSLRVTSLVAAKKSAALLVAPDVAMANALTQTSGSMARLVLNAGRDTVNQTVRADDQATGWRRILGGGGCDFCKLLAGRVYPSDNAGFDAHDKCGCTSEPVYGS